MRLHGSRSPSSAARRWLLGHDEVRLARESVDNRFKDWSRYDATMGGCKHSHNPAIRAWADQATSTRKPTSRRVTFHQVVLESAEGCEDNSASQKAIGMESGTVLGALSGASSSHCAGRMAVRERIQMLEPPSATVTLVHFAAEPYVAKPPWCQMPGPSIARIVQVTVGLSAVGVMIGSVLGAILAALFGVRVGDFGFASEIWFAGAMLGAGVGGVLAPVAAWTLMRRVPIWRAIAETAAGTVLGTTLGLIFPRLPAPWLGVLGFVTAATRLWLTHRRPRSGVGR
jgi:hypothetical protein